MADIELLIKIPEEQKKMVDDITELPPQVENDLISAIRHGTRLPKEHGRLKDVDAFIAKVKADRTHACYVRSWTADDVLLALDNTYAPTIINAERW